MFVTFNENNVGFGCAYIKVAPLIKEHYVLLLNTDVFWASDTLDKAFAWMYAHSDCGVLGD